MYNGMFYFLYYLDNIRQIQRELEGDDSEEEEEEEEDATELKWKDGMKERASQAFYNRQSNSTNLRNLATGSKLICFQFFRIFKFFDIF